MAGHTSEKRWRSGMNPKFSGAGVSEQASAICTQMLDALTAARAAFLEMQEVYTYVGGTVNDLALQLFAEDISARQVPGTNFAMTVDVVGGEVTAITVTQAGAGYTDGLYNQDLTFTAGGGTINATYQYTVEQGSVSEAIIVNVGEGYTDGLAQNVIDINLAGTVPDTVPSAEEVQKSQDLFDAITALNELNQAADNVAVTAEDRYAQLRRMT